MTDQLTSLLARELTILSKNFGELGRTCWQLGRVLLRDDLGYATDGSHKGQSGAEAGGRSELLAMVDSVSAPDEPLWLQEEMSWE